MTPTEMIAALRAGRNVWITVAAGCNRGRYEFTPAPAANVVLDPTADQTYLGLVVRPGRPPIVGTIARDRGRIWVTDAVPVGDTTVIASVWLPRAALIGVHVEDHSAAAATGR